MNPDTSLAVATAPNRNSLHWRQGTVTWGEIIGWLDTPADTKEAGNYFLGTLHKTTAVHKKDGPPCVGLHRNNIAVVSRSAITLDADSPRADLPDVVEMLLGSAAVVHTTYSSSPDDLRYRVILPASRELLPDEYHVAVTALMERLGADQFDPSSVEPARYMFKPAAQEPGWFKSWVFDGPALDVDDLLEKYDPDLSKLPQPKPHRNKRDPYDIDGTVGAFNRAYEDWQTLIDEYELPYEPAQGTDRWQLVGAASVAGMGVMGPGLVFSHHVTDPAYGQACSAFDLVRLHRFGDMDAGKEDVPVNRRPSHAAMLDLASRDAKVVTDLVGGDFSEQLGDWKLDLKLNSKTGEMLDRISNWKIVTANDPAFDGLYFNELTLAIETSRDLPWRTISNGGATFSGTDREALDHYLEEAYGLLPTVRRRDAVVNTTAMRTRVNPVRDYLESLAWDGESRVETCLPGVQPTAYTRMVARKCMAAAVARMFRPGIKWDHTLVLFGPEGLGKSYWVDLMSRGYSATLGRIGDKDTLLTMQRSWIMIADEGYSLRKADADVQKEFLTRREDVFRMPYDREAMAHPRHSVIWGTTNDEVFLRRQEGNRRFLIVRCEEKVDFTALTDDYIDQVWAEAVHLYREGELLFLDDDESGVASLERENFIEEDALAGVVEEFLNTPVPSDWADMSPDARVAWRQSFADGLVAAGDSQIMETCSAQIWVEALNKRFGDHRRSDLLEINTALKRVPGWVPLPGRQRVAHYGPQQIFIRKGTTSADLDEVI